MPPETTPTRRGGGRKAQPVRIIRSVERVCRLELIERRDRCMNKIIRLRNETNAYGHIADQAKRLLTQHWSAASWRLRADILRTAEWLLSIGKNNTIGEIPAPEEFASSLR